MGDAVVEAGEDLPRLGRHDGGLVVVARKTAN